MVPAILPKVTQFHKSFEMRQNSFSKLTIETTSSCKFQPYPKHLSTLGLLSFFLANTVRFLCYTLYVFEQWQSLFRLRFASLKVGNSALQFDTALSIRKSASTAQEQRPSNIIIFLKLRDSNRIFCANYNSILAEHFLPYRIIQTRSCMARGTSGRYPQSRPGWPMRSSQIRKEHGLPATPRRSPVWLINARAYRPLSAFKT